jgi:hypothetical protein
MKNIISENSINQMSEFVNDNKCKFDYDQNHYVSVEQKQMKMPVQKIFKGKVKVYNSSKKLQNIQNVAIDDESELNIISNRMLLFLKITFLFVLLFFCLYYSKLN